MGQTNPPEADGQVNMPPLPTPIFVPMDMNVDGKPVEILFLGAAYGEVAGISQINVRIPAAAYRSNQVSISFAGASATLYVAQ